jgi:hypothetical protein
MARGVRRKQPKPRAFDESVATLHPKLFVWRGGIAVVYGREGSWGYDITFDPQDGMVTSCTIFLGWRTEQDAMEAAIRHLSTIKRREGELDFPLVQHLPEERRGEVLAHLVCSACWHDCVQEALRAGWPESEAFAYADAQSVVKARRHLETINNERSQQ